MSRKKILILGGTKFLGSKLLEKLKFKKELQIHVASRKSTDFGQYHSIERKNEEDLLNLFKAHTFDIVIDFICYSQPDAKKLLDVIKVKAGYQPYVIMISSTYVYGNPLELQVNKSYDENEFDPESYQYSELDRPDIDYFEGKKSMEAYIAQNYQNYLLVRFPIIMGSNDYTGRTAYFSDLIKNSGTVSFDEMSGSSNFIFSQEAADVLSYFIAHPIQGAINCSLEDELNQSSILSLYCKFHGVPLRSVLVNEGLAIRSPFYYSKDFIINNARLKSLVDLKSKFEPALFRELTEMKLHP